MVEITLGRNDIADHPFGARQALATAQHRVVQLEALDRKVSTPCIQESARKSHFSIAVARPYADETADTTARSFVALNEKFREEFVRVADAKCFEFRPHIAVRPIMEYRWQDMDVGIITESVEFRGKFGAVASSQKCNSPTPQGVSSGICDAA